MKCTLPLILFVLLIACKNKSIKKDSCYDSLLFKSNRHLTNNSVADFSDTVDTYMGNDYGNSL